MELYRHMAVFAAVAEAGSFTVAARKLGIAKSAVSRMVSDLERQLGISLFSRTTRRIALTEPGTAYYESCSRMVAEATNATAALRNFRVEPTGRLRVSAAISLARYVLPVVTELTHRHPQLYFDLRFEDRFVNLMEEDVDVAVRGGNLQDSTLIARSLAPVAYVVCAAPKYLKQRGVPRVLQDLTRHEWIGYGLGMSQQLAARRHGRNVRVTVGGRVHVNNGVAVLGLLRAGEGISLAPMWEVADDLRTGRLRVVLADYEFKTSAVYFVSPIGKHRLPKVRVFHEKLAKRLNDVGWDRIERSWIARVPSGRR